MLQVFLVAQECGFRLPTDHTISPSLSLHPELAKFLVEFAVPGSFRAQLLISSSCFPRVHRTASITRFAAHALWVITPPRVSPGFTGQRLSLNSFPRTVGSAPHQGACADLNRGCTWACRRLRRACSCSVRVSSASCGVHCASTSNVLRRASTGTNVLVASACSLCRTCCYRNRWLRFSPCRVHRLHLHLWWRTSRRRQQFMLRPAPVMVYIALASAVSYAAQAHVLEYFAPAPAACAVPIVTATGGFASLPVVLIVFTCTCGGVRYVCTSSVRGTCTCRGVHRASTSGVRNTCGGVLCASTISVRCTCICLVYIEPAPAVYEHLLWCTSRWHQQCTLHLCLSYNTSRQHKQSCAVPAQVLVYFVTTPVAYAAPIATAVGWLCFSPCRAHRLHKNFGDYIAPASAVFAAPSPVV